MKQWKEICERRNISNNIKTQCKKGYLSRNSSQRIKELERMERKKAIDPANINIENRAYIIDLIKILYFSRYSEINIFEKRLFEYLCLYIYKEGKSISMLQNQLLQICTKAGKPEFITKFEGILRLDINHNINDKIIKPQLETKISMFKHHNQQFKHLKTTEDFLNKINEELGIKLLRPAPKPPLAGTPPPLPGTPPLVSVTQKYVADTNNDNTISVEENDTVTIIEDNGWIKVKKENGDVGYIPSWAIKGAGSTEA